MYKFCSIQFKGHPVLGNLSLNFCDKTGNPVDTVILAGENGVGKSTILHEIYHILSNAIHCEIEMEIINELKEKYKIHYFRNPEIDDQILHIKIERYVGNELCGSGSLSKLGLKGIYSDTEIGFKGSQIYTVSSSQLDALWAIVCPRPACLMK